MRTIWACVFMSLLALGFGEYRFIPASQLLDADVRPYLGEEIDFDSIVQDELHSRHQDVTESCTSCVVPPTSQACKLAWSKLMGICKGADPSSDLGKFCEASKADPQKFIIEKVLRAEVNPLDVAYKICYWKGDCPSSGNSKSLEGIWQAVVGFFADKSTASGPSADQAAMDALVNGVKNFSLTSAECENDAVC